MLNPLRKEKDTTEEYKRDALDDVIRKELHNSVAECYFAVFDEELANGPVTIEVDIELPKETTVSITCADQVFSFTLPEGRGSYSVSVSVPSKLITLTVPECDSHIYGYKIL